MSKLKLPSINALLFPQGNGIEEKIYSRWQPHVRAEDDDDNTITIYQPIGESFWEDGFTARRMSAALRSIGKKADVIVSINSPGGDFFEGATIYNLLREHEGHVTVKIPGLAASAASVIAMAGDTIKISQVGFLMIHNAWGCVCGNRNDMRECADVFEKFDSAMADLYAARTKFDRGEIVKMMDKDTWMNGADAVEKGFAEEILEAKVIDEVIDDDKKAKAFARRAIEAALAKQGFSRKDREDVMKNAFGVCDTALVAARDAGERQAGLTALLKTIKER